MRFESSLVVLEQVTVSPVPVTVFDEIPEDELVVVDMAVDVEVETADCS